jgi:alpha-galactosidase
MEEKNYLLGATIVKYLINEQKQVSFVLVPKICEKDVKNPWDIPPDKFNAVAIHNKDWRIGSLVQLHLRHHSRSGSGGNTMKYSESVSSLKFTSQELLESAVETKIITILTADEGYKVSHTLTHPVGQTGFIVETTFINESEKELTLEMLSSFSFDNLSPFQTDDAPNKINLHRFKGGWSLEGKHICEPIENLSLEKAWFNAFTESERFGVIGSWPVGRYFPMALVEDKECGVLWGAQISHNASWQMELTRYGDTLSFSGGLADMDFGGWYKTLMPSECFTAPPAFITAIKGDHADTCQSITQLHNIACNAFGEEGLPIVFNEWCTSWGNPTHENMVGYAKKLKDSQVKYLVIDAGWTCTPENSFGQGSNGEWNIDTNKFPDIKETSRMLREEGYTPGIWFEFEVTTKGARVYESDYDEMHLKRDGIVINTGGGRTFWDFRNPSVTQYLTEKVIDFLKDNDFGYLKVDYNGSIGLGCDGSDSLGEGLREHMDAVRNFFIQIKRQIPDIIIENCASGGHRSEPSMMGVTALTSFSDAHECIEIPYVAANLHYLMLPRQSLVFATLHGTDSDQRLKYSLSATFLGRMCLSGDIMDLSEDQWDILRKSEDFYTKVAPIIKDGKTKIYGNRSLNMRYPEGTQVVVRSTQDEILVVCHAFNNPSNEIEIELPKAHYTIVDSYYNDYISLNGNRLIVSKMASLTGCAIRLS